MTRSVRKLIVRAHCSVQRDAGREPAVRHVAAPLRPDQVAGAARKPGLLVPAHARARLPDRAASVPARRHGPAQPIEVRPVSCTRVRLPSRPLLRGPRARCAMHSERQRRLFRGPSFAPSKLPEDVHHATMNEGETQETPSPLSAPYFVRCKISPSAPMNERP